MAGSKKRVGDTDFNHAAFKKLAAKANLMMPPSLLNVHDRQNVPAVLRFYQWFKLASQKPEDLDPSVQLAFQDLSSLVLYYTAIYEYYYNNHNNLTTKLEYASVAAHALFVLYRHSGTYP